MTRTETIEFLKQLSEEDCKKHNIPILYDISHEKCIHEKDFDYYPELCCVIIKGIIVKWDESADWVSPYNPEYIKTFINHATDYRNAVDTMIMIADRNKTNTITAEYANPEHPAAKKFLKKNLPFIQFDETTIYYYPDRIDLKNNKHDRLIAQALLLTKKQEVFGLDAEKNVPSDEWMALDWI